MKEKQGRTDGRIGGFASSEKSGSGYWSIRPGYRADHWCTKDVAIVGDADVASRLAVFPARPPGDNRQVAAMEPVLPAIVWLWADGNYTLWLPPTHPAHLFGNKPQLALLLPATIRS